MADNHQKEVRTIINELPKATQTLTSNYQKEAQTIMNRLQKATQAITSNYQKEAQTMMTVHEVSRLTGVSIRALHHYDKIGLLHPTEVTEAGYRLYDDTALERLQCIMLFKELEFPLKEISAILDSPVFDRNLALDQQITLLRMKKEHLENLIDLACGIKMIGVKKLDFTAFNTKKDGRICTTGKRILGQNCRIP